MPTWLAIVCLVVLVLSCAYGVYDELKKKKNEKKGDK